MVVYEYVLRNLCKHESSKMNVLFEHGGRNKWIREKGKEKKTIRKDIIQFDNLQNKERKMSIYLISVIN